MNPELDNKLCEAYPLIFADRHKSMTVTCMCWGFECGDGWYNIIDQLCYNIQHHIDYNKRRQGVGVELEDIPQVVAVQVKEKFGSLRFYYDGGDDFISGLVAMAESMSTVTCMTCGKPGTMQKEGWWHVACEEHKSD
jgi:hypothetical protein